jgi:2-polyprenyl-3-methyl-5-hydroxy-6-metoxy-1,4-benzoquinol methylase
MGKRFRPQGNRRDGNRQDRGNRHDKGRKRGWSRRDANSNRADREGGGPAAWEGGSSHRAEKRVTEDFWNRLLPAGEDNEFLEKSPCPACGKIPARIKGRLGPTLLRKCRSCSLIYISPRLATSVRQEMLRRAPAPLSSERNLWLRHQMAELMERMHREMPVMEGMNKKSATLLEIGCRWGHFLQLCRPHYRSVEGLEWSKERAAFARERFDLEVSATDIFRDPWDNRYNVVAAWDVMEREPHPLEFLRWVHDHLEPKGLLVLSTPNHDSLSRRLLRKRWYHYQPSRHLCYFSPSTLSALLRDAGFTDIRIRTSGLSSWRDWFSGNNRVDRSLDARDQWLDNLRDIEAIDDAKRAGQTTIGRESPARKIWKRIAGVLSSIITAPGWGDQMRVYARRS